MNSLFKVKNQKVWRALSFLYPPLFAVIFFALNVSGDRIGSAITGFVWGAAPAAINLIGKHGYEIKDGSVWLRQGLPRVFLARIADIKRVERGKNGDLRLVRLKNDGSERRGAFVAPVDEAGFLAALRAGGLDAEVAI